MVIYSFTQDTWNVVTDCRENEQIAAMDTTTNNYLHRLSFAFLKMYYTNLLLFYKTRKQNFNQFQSIIEEVSRSSLQQKSSIKRFSWNTNDKSFFYDINPRKL